MAACQHRGRALGYAGEQEWNGRGTDESDPAKLRVYYEQDIQLLRVLERRVEELKLKTQRQILVTALLCLRTSIPKVVSNRIMAFISANAPLSRDFASIPQEIEVGSKVLISHLKPPNDANERTGTVKCVRKWTYIVEMEKYDWEDKPKRVKISRDKLRRISPSGVVLEIKGAGTAVANGEFLKSGSDGREYLHRNGLVKVFYFNMVGGGWSLLDLRRGICLYIRSNEKGQYGVEGEWEVHDGKGPAPTGLLR